jgi:hypothetical protein
MTCWETHQQDSEDTYNGLDELMFKTLYNFLGGTLIEIAPSNLDRLTLEWFTFAVDFSRIFPRTFFSLVLKKNLG